MKDADHYVPMLPALPADGMCALSEYYRTSVLTQRVAQQSCSLKVSFDPQREAEDIFSSSFVLSPLHTLSEKTLL